MTAAAPATVTAERLKRLMRSVLRIGAGVAVALVPLSAWLYVSQDRMLFFPRPLEAGRAAQIARLHPRVEYLDLTAADGTRLRAWLAKPAQSDRFPLAVYFGGNAEEVSWLLDESSRDRRFGWLLVSYRGYGESQGRPSEPALFSDAVAWYDLMAARADIDNERIVVLGRSLGSGVAVYLASQRPVAALTLITPYDSIRAVARRHYPWLPVGLLLRHPFDSLQRAPALQVPALFLVAANDVLIPAVHAQRLHDAWGGETQWMEIADADHNDIEFARDYWQALNSFMQRWVDYPGANTPSSASVTDAAGTGDASN